ncbi:uncharacterized protein [Halyomorpha halys]|uniref:uncharacterized protein n=1 Tax=Halyomorpha halys TaxID=286706 RepID=UPI0034D2EC3D
MDPNRGKFERGIDVKQLVRLPLLPTAIRDGVISSLDASSTVRNQLRGLLALDKIERHNQENEEEYSKAVNNLRKAEWTLMENHAGILLNKEKLCVSLPNSSMNDFNIPEDLATEYNLLTFSPFLNFLRNERQGGPFESCIDRPCPHLYSLRETAEKSLKKFVPKEEPQVASSNVKKAATTYFSRESTKTITMQVIPEEVVFENFEAGNTYSVKVILQNSGANSALLRFVRPQDDSFEITLAKKYNMLAPGLSVELTVYFHCRDKDDRMDKFVVQPGGGRCVTVPIKAVQTPPFLHSYLYYIAPETEVSPLNSTIDCGRVYVGTVNIVRVRVTNMGSHGRFFIMSEASWYFNMIKDTTMENILVLKPFYIQPMYFSIGHMKKRNLKVIFSPQWEGSHLTQVFFLCDNITMRSVDVMGEGVMFDPDLFVIEGLEKNHNVMIEGDDSAKYCLYLGRVLTNSTTQKTFDIANNSVVETKFTWQVCRSDTPDVNFFDAEHGSITPSTGTLCAEVKMMFTVSFNSLNLPVGKYGAIFSIYLECIPKVALMKKHNKCQKEDISKLMVKVLLGKIEVCADIEPPNVCIWPNYIYFLNEPNVWNFMKIYVTNYENISITVAWRMPLLKNLLLFPPVVDLAPFSSTFIYVLLQTEVVGKFVGTLSAFFIQSLCIYEVRVEVDSTIAITSGMSEMVDFGILRKGESKTGTIHATFPTTLEVDVELRHFAMRYNKKTGLPYFHLFQNSGSVIQCPVSLIPNKPSEVVFKPRTEEESICIDLFEWRFCNIQAYTTILSDVQEQDITLKPVVLDIQEPLFVGASASYPIIIINHRQMKTSFSFENFFGKDVDFFKFIVRPKNATLPPTSETEVNLTMLPITTCIFQNLYYSLSIKNMEKPLIGKIRGYVRHSLVTFSWLSNGKEKVFKWPQEECDETRRQYPSAVTSVSSGSSDKDCEICFSEDFTAGSSLKSISMGEKIEAEIMMFVDSSDNDIIPYDNWPYIGGKYFGAEFTDENLRKDFEAPWTEESLNEHLKCFEQEDRDSFLARFSENSMTFTVDTFKVYNQILYIANMSPSTVQYKVKTNFFHSERKLPPMDPFHLSEMIFHDQSLGYDDSPTLEKYKWQFRVRKHLGLAIRVKEKSGTIQPFQVQAVPVSVFAMAWGTYFDNISIYVDNHPPFHVPVMVKCEYPPAFFTFAPETISPLLRFPSIRPNGTRWKQVYLENTCPFLLKIVWTVYLDKQPGEESCKELCLPLERDPIFGLALELHPKKDSEFCKLKLVPYAGVQENLRYTIEPSILYIPPRTKAPIIITVDSGPTSMEIAKRKGTLSATALGVVYIEDDSWNNEEYFCCYRPDGYGTNPISLKMLTTVEELNFQVINNSKRDLIFEVNTAEIFNTDKELTFSRTFHFQNNCISEALISMEVQEPFQIISIETRKGPLKDLAQEFLVECLQTIQVVVRLTLNKTILTKSTILRPSYISQEGPIISDLNLGMKGAMENIIRLELRLLKPVFKFPKEKINFGQTCIMHTIEKYIDVHVENGDQPFKVRFVKNEEDAFRVRPLLGMMREGKPAQIIIEFAPKECRRYVNAIEFISSTPGSIYPLFVEGIGSLDHKFYT